MPLFTRFACRPAALWGMMCAVLVTLVCSRVIGQPVAVPPQVASEIETPDEVDRWVKELDDNRFVVRRIATEKLILAGEAAIQPVANAMAGSNLEVLTRGIYVLRELALSKDVSTQEAAVSALEGLTKSSQRSAARQAQEAITALGEVRQQRAIKELQELGAKVIVLDRTLAFQQDRRVMVEIGPAWQGTPKDLQQLKWARDVQEIAFIGIRITDPCIQSIEYLDNLQRLVIKHANVTDDALRSVSQLKRITHLDLMYTPVTDACLEHLKGVKTLSLIRLYGTEVSSGGVERFQKLAANVQIDLKGGAFLGVRCTQSPFPCEVTEVTDDSAAQRAGVQPRDIIVRYGGHPVADFDVLRELIAKNKVGDTVLIQVARGGSPVTSALERATRRSARDGGRAGHVRIPSHEGRQGRWCRQGRHSGR